MSRYYDRQGNPLTTAEWGKLLTDENKIVAADTLDSGTAISTIWLGLDYSWGNGPPLIFETMVFGGPFDGDEERYSTEAEALAGHAAMIVSVTEREAEHYRVEKLRDAAPRLAAALKEIAEWPNGGNRYGQKNIKEFARAALREAGVES